MMGLSLLALLVAGAFAEEPSLPPPPPDVDLVYSAEHVDYDKFKTMLHMKGSVMIKESTWTIKGSELWLDTKTRRARSEGYLLVDDGMSALSGDSGEFDFHDHSGRLFETKGGHGDWRIHAKSVTLAPDRRLGYRSADFTSCSFKPPHYHLRASRITVVPRKGLLALNVVYYLGPVPIFYVPFLYKSLKDRHLLRFKVEPGYDRRNGAYLKNTMLTEHSPYFHSKLYIDYYTKQGIGTGGELHRHKGEDSRGALFVYRIGERGGGERWSVLGDQYQKLVSSVSMQGRLQVQSDGDFNNHYSRASLFRVVPELINSAALVYQLPSMTARLSYSRIDTADATRLRFLKSRESYPRLDVNSAQLKWGRLPWLNTLSGFAENSYDRSRSYIEKTAGSGWEGTQSYLLMRGVSFTPKLGYGQTYFNRFDALSGRTSSDTVRDVFIGRYSTEGTLRFMTFAGDWDVTHAMRRRQKPGTFRDDRDAADYGVETNLVSVEDSFRPTRKVLVRLQSGYDFRVFRDHMPGFRRRVEPIVGEVSYSPKPSFNLSARDDYQLEGGNRSFLLSGTLGDERATFFNVGAGYNLATATRYFINTEFGVANSSQTLRVGGALRSVVSSSGGIARLHGFEVFEKELFVAKHWHDFFTRISGRLRPGGVQEVVVRIDLKLGRIGADRGAKRRDWESEWFPERAKGVEDRP